jgi:hypothetical protein
LILFINSSKNYKNESIEMKRVSVSAREKQNWKGHERILKSFGKDLYFDWGADHMDE